MATKKIDIKGVLVRTMVIDNQDYICITDIAKTGKRGEPRFAIQNYLNRKNTIEYFGLWEQMNHNENFNVVGFHNIRNEIGSNNYTISFKDWIGDTNAIGVKSFAGRYGGTYVHIDIGLHFTAWFDVEFNLYFIKEFQRLKTDEIKRLGKPFDISRLMSKGTFPLLSEGIKESIPIGVKGTKKEGIYFASEVDMINVILFGVTAKQWKNQNPKRKTGENMRDYATTTELLILSALQALNERLLKWDCDRQQRYNLLTEAASDWKRILTNKKSIQELTKRIDKQKKLRGKDDDNIN
jgi:hypothetical protein